MSSPQGEPKVPEAAVEALAERSYNRYVKQTPRNPAPRWSELDADSRAPWIFEAERDLQPAVEAILSALLSDEAIRAGCEAAIGQTGLNPRDERAVRTAIEAAIEKLGGGE